MGGAAAPRCRGSTLVKPRLPESNLRIECRSLICRICSCVYPPRRRDLTRLRGPALRFRLHVPTHPERREEKNVFTARQPPFAPGEVASAGPQVLGRLRSRRPPRDVAPPRHRRVPWRTWSGLAGRLPPAAVPPRDR